MMKFVKKFLKNISILAYFNSIIKDFILRAETFWIKHIYYGSLANNLIPDNVYIHDIVQKRMLHDNIKPLSSSNKKLHIYFVGTYYDHEGFGFIQSLKRFGDVIIFYDKNGKYGINSSMEDSSKDFIVANSNYLLKDVNEVHALNPIDFLIGTFTAPTISLDTLQAIRKLGIPVVNYAMDDRLPVHWKKVSGKQRGAIGLVEGVDLTLQTTKEFIPRYLSKGGACIYFPFGSDSDIFKPNSIKDIDVLFIGNNYGKREYLVREIQKSGISILCYGTGFPNGHLSGNLVPEMFARAKIILGTGLIGHSSKIVTLKLRDFDAPMSGALYITKFNEDLSEFFEFNKEIVIYNNVNECIDKLKYYLENKLEREIISNAGRERCIKQHNWDQRIRILISILTSKE